MQIQAVMMNRINLLTFIIILFIPTIVSSAKCKNPELKCIELCCEVGQIYDLKRKECVSIPWILRANTNTSWHALMYGSKTVEYVEFGECETSNDSFVTNSDVINSCHSPYYQQQVRQYILQEYFNVPCDRSQILLSNIVLQIGYIVIPAMLPILPLMLLYSCTRSNEKNNLSFKLVTWYFTSMAAALFALALWLLIEETVEQEVANRIDLVWEFFLTSTFLWLNVIGYEIWMGFKEANVQSNSGSAQKRLVWYSIYVWGTTAVIHVIHCLILKERSADVIDWPKYLIACFNVITFLVLSLKICLIRCRVAKMTNEPHFICHLIRIILRLCLMMGIPRMLLLILEPLPFIGVFPIAFMLWLEPYLVFMAFVATKEIRCRPVCSKCCCCSGHPDEKKETATETKLTNTTTV